MLANRRCTHFFSLIFVHRHKTLFALHVTKSDKKAFRIKPNEIVVIFTKNDLRILCGGASTSATSKLNCKPRLEYKTFLFITIYLSQWWCYCSRIKICFSFLHSLSLLAWLTTDEAASDFEKLLNIFCSLTYELFPSSFSVQNANRMLYHFHVSFLLLLSWEKRKTRSFVRVSHTRIYLFIHSENERHSRLKHLWFSFVRCWMI